jgi:hypothetical protein
MNRAVITKDEFPVKDMTPRPWESKTKRRVAKYLIESGNGGGFLREGYQIMWHPKPGYPGNNVLCLEFYDND